MARIVAAFILSALASPAAAAMDSATMHKADGLAQIISWEEACSLSVDQDALDRYVGDQGLDAPDVLSYINNSVKLEASYGKPPSASQCTIARSTARSIGIIKH